MLNQTQNKGFLFVLNVLLANLRKPAKCIFLCSLGSHFTFHLFCSSFIPAACIEEYFKTCQAVSIIYN